MWRKCADAARSLPNTGAIAESESKSVPLAECKRVGYRDCEPVSGLGGAVDCGLIVYRDRRVIRSERERIADERRPNPHRHDGKRGPDPLV
jgi:hypothetical protein